MITKHLVRLTLCASFAILAPRAQGQTSDHTITVLSTGSAVANAEHVSLQLSVVSQDQTATAIFVKQTDVVQHLKKALETAGVLNIHELPFRLMPNYEYGQQGTRIIGYRLETPIEVNVSDLKALPHIIDVATQSGASSVTVGAFGLTNQSGLHEEALRDAIRGSHKEAETIGKEIGHTIGDVLSVTEVEDEGKPTASRGGEEEEERREKSKSTNAQASTLSEKAEVRVVYQLK